MNRKNLINLVERIERFGIDADRLDEAVGELVNIKANHSDPAMQLVAAVLADEVGRLQDRVAELEALLKRQST